MVGGGGKAVLMLLRLGFLLGFRLGFHLGFLPGGGSGRRWVAGGAAGAEGWMGELVGGGGGGCGGQGMGLAGNWSGAVREAAREAGGRGVGREWW